MKRLVSLLLLTALALPVMAQATQAEDSTPLVLTLEDALKIAMSESIPVQVADQEILRTQYAYKGTYASLFPQIDASASYQRTIKKQVMYMDFDMGAFAGGAMGGDDTATAQTQSSSRSSSGGGIEVGRWNTFSGGVSAGLPLVNAQLWRSIKISAQDVELAVEKARGSRLEMVTQVKRAYYSVLLAKEALSVYEEVLQNAIENFKQTEMRYNVDKASELDYNRAKTTVSNAIPNVNEAESSVFLALWQLKAVIGLDLDREIDVADALADHAREMLRDIHENQDYSLEGNSTLRQLEMQAEELANTIRLQKDAYLPTLSLSFSYMLNAMTNDFNFSEYRWSPYSFVGLSLSIPIFSGGKRLNAVRQTQVQHQQLLLQQKNTERQLNIAIHQYLNQMETYMKSYAAAQDAVTTAHKAYDIAAKSYNVGRSTLTDLNDAQLALTQSQLGESQVIYNYLVAKANLEQTLGQDFTE